MMDNLTRAANVGDMVGKTMNKITGMTAGSKKVVFKTVDGDRFEMFHEQDCCEDVLLEDVCGDVNNLIGTPIAEAYVECNATTAPKEDKDSIFLWTFYKFRTIKGTVTLRWYGTSNGWYSVSVNLVEVL